MADNANLMLHFFGPWGEIILPALIRVRQSLPLAGLMVTYQGLNLLLIENQSKEDYSGVYGFAVNDRKRWTSRLVLLPEDQEAVFLQGPDGENDELFPTRWTEGDPMADEIPHAPHEPDDHEFDDGLLPVEPPAVNEVMKFLGEDGQTITLDKPTTIRWGIRVLVNTPTISGFLPRGEYWRYAPNFPAGTYVINEAGLRLEDPAPGVKKRLYSVTEEPVVEPPAPAPVERALPPPFVVTVPSAIKRLTFKEQFMSFITNASQWYKMFSMQGLIGLLIFCLVVMFVPGLVGSVFHMALIVAVIAVVIFFLRLVKQEGLSAAVDELEADAGKLYQRARDWTEDEFGGKTPANSTKPVDPMA